MSVFSDGFRTLEDPLGTPQSRLGCRRSLLQDRRRAAGAIIVALALLVQAPLARAALFGEIFRDEFDGELKGGWSWTREDATSWSMAARSGYLTIGLDFGDLWATWTNNARNMLLRPAPQGNFRIEAHVEAQLDHSINQALILLHADDDNYLRYGVINDAGVIRFDAVIETGGNPAGMGVGTPSSGDAHFRMDVEDGTVTLYSSDDGQTWRTEIVRALPFVPASIGLVAFDGSEPPSNSTAAFDYFSVGIQRTLFLGQAITLARKAPRRLNVATFPPGTPASGRLLHRRGGESRYRATPWVAGVADTISFALADSLIAVRGLEFYFQVAVESDTVTLDNAGEPYEIISQLMNAESQRPQSLPNSSYRIVSMPLEIDPPFDVGSVFVDDLGYPDLTQWRLLEFQPAPGGGDLREFPLLSPVRPGRGYWLIERNGGTYGATGRSVRPHRIIEGRRYYQVQTRPGWNQLGNPFAFPVLWDAVRFESPAGIGGFDSTLVEPVAYWYDGERYREIGSQRRDIPAWEGVFLYVKRDSVDILLPYEDADEGETIAVAGAARPAPAPVPGSTRSGVSPLTWRIRAALIVDGVEKDQVELAVDPAGRDGEDPADRRKPPACPEERGGITCIGIDSAGLVAHLERDARDSESDGHAWTVELRAFPGTRSEIIWTVHGRTGEDFVARAIDPQRSDPIALAGVDPGSGSYVVQDGDPSHPIRLSVVAGTASYVEGAIQRVRVDTGRLELASNYPNPFARGTHIRFRLPGPMPVSLAIYDVNGRRVTELARQRMLEGGWHAFSWPGSDEGSRPLPCGVYFCNLVAGDRTLVRKMILMR